MFIGDLLLRFRFVLMAFFLVLSLYDEEIQREGKGREEEEDIHRFCSKRREKRTIYYATLHACTDGRGGWIHVIRADRLMRIRP